MRTHGLPGEPGDTAWFERMNAFEQQETRRQVAFKRKHWPDLPDGIWAKKKGEAYTYPHIVPDRDKALYPGIAGDVLRYFQSNNVAVHSEFLNLKSSQACCFNVLFPLHQDLALAEIALKPVLPGVKSVMAIEFEYTGPEGATAWLGEPSGGHRGAYRTSIDAAVWWKSDAGSYLTFIEWKYTEKTYGVCGGYQSKGNKHRRFCETMVVSVGAHPQGCYLTEGKNTRRYWDHLSEAGISLAALSRCSGCPFRGPFYQLMRQYLLAAYCRRCEPVEDVFVVAVGFGGNTFLHDVPSELANLGGNIEGAWNACLSEVPLIEHVSVESIIASIRAANRSAEAEWLAYLNDRYGL